VHPLPTPQYTEVRLTRAVEDMLNTPREASERGKRKEKKRKEKEIKYIYFKIN
jgi:hypothetical protein